MSRQSNDIEVGLRRCSRPALPEGLRDRVMATAVLASSFTTWQDRAWFSRSWRLAAVGVLLALLTIDHWSGEWGHAALAEPDRARIEEVADIAVLGSETSMPADAMLRLAARLSISPYGGPDAREQTEQAARDFWR